MQNNKHQEKATSDNEIQAQEPNNIPTHQVFATIDETGKIYIPGPIQQQQTIRVSPIRL